MRFLPLIFIAFLISCGNSDHGNSHDTEIPDRTGNFVHTVYLNIHDTLPQNDIDFMILEMKKIQDIPKVLNFTCGEFEDVMDDRAMDRYELVMQMEFDNIDDYKIYQEHPIHLNLRKVAAGYLSERPAVHDFIIH
ncbi:MAG: Dabb family protein [Chitinophagales bacterium]|nr:Dabb family protein [Chitinophagales bacterium]